MVIVSGGEARTPPNTPRHSFPAAIRKPKKEVKADTVSA